MDAVFDPAVPWLKRKRCIRSLAGVFEQIFAWVRDANRRVSLSRKSAPIGKHLLGLDVLVSGNVKHHGDAVDFGSQQLPTESKSRAIRFEIVNTGSNAATIDSATLSSQHFSVPQWSTPKTIEPGERLGFMIHPGMPVEIGDKTAIFTLSKSSPPQTDVPTPLEPIGDCHQSHYGDRESTNRPRVIRGGKSTKGYSGENVKHRRL